MRITIPTQLRSYTKGASEVVCSGATVAELLKNLDAAFPGIRFRMIDEQDRIRQHVRVFVNRELVQGLGQMLNETDEIQILCAISGGCDQRRALLT